MFDLGEAILPSRPQNNFSAVSSGGQGWPPLRGHPKGSSLTAVSTAAGSGVAGQKTMGVGPHFPLPLPVPPTTVGKRKREAIKNRALDVIRKRDPAHWQRNKTGRSGTRADLRLKLHQNRLGLDRGYHLGQQS